MPDDAPACHSCDTPACVNPEHVFPGTAQDNYDDAVSKKRSMGRKPAATGRAVRRVTIPEADVAMTDPAIPLDEARRLFHRAYRYLRDDRRAERLADLEQARLAGLTAPPKKYQRGRTAILLAHPVKE
jgi:hypothetical protein